MNLVGIGSRRVLLVGLHSISPLFRLVYLNEVAQRVGVHIRTLVCERVVQRIHATTSRVNARGIEPLTKIQRRLRH